MRQLRLVPFLLALGSALCAEIVPGRYIVELTTEPVAEHVARRSRREGMRGPMATAHRARLRTEQQQMRRRLSAGGRVLDSVDTVANALFVEIPDSEAAQLAALPGVLRVHPVRTFHLLLDRAVAVNRIAEAWDQVGADHAGAGVKIAIIDTGIDVSHPGFQDASLPALDSYPRTTAATDQAYTNNKIIVARSYVNLLQNRNDPDRSAQDRVGHGTALAMVAAGARNTGPLATITGAAPKAYIGNYKVFGSPGFNDGATDDAILKAIDDAVSDGMDIISISLGSDLASRLEDDVEVKAVERAFAAGVLVVVAAGNNGSDLNTISSPATAPSAISVGASRNDREFAASVEVSGLQPSLAVTGSGSKPVIPITAQIVDVAALDQTGLACATLPAGSLQGRIGLILRGDCTFEIKLNNAQQAGAVAAVVYAAQASPDPISMAAGASTLPAEMVSYDDGIAIKQSLGAQPLLFGTLRFTVAAVPRDANRLASFSAAGPNVDRGIKPELVAVGADMYVATQKLDTAGEMYNATGYIVVDGTSFSTPLVAGAAALLKSARPGLTAAQYRSLLINSASPINARPGVPSSVQQSGAGQLNLLAAINGTVAAYPAMLNFSSGGPDLRLSAKLTLTNVGTSTESYTLTVEPTGEGSAPALASGSVQLEAGATVEAPLSWTGAGLASGSHEGFVRITGSNSGVEMRIPYWYAVTSTTPARISILDTKASARRGTTSRDAILLRITDSAGLPLTSAPPDVSITSGGGTVSRIVSYDLDVPGLYGIDLRLGPTAGANVVRIQAGDITTNVSITGN